jgi:hypothetical protein
MKKLELEIADSLFEYIEKLVTNASFETINSFATHAIYWLAELYGFSEQTEGKSLSGLIADVIVSKLGKGGVEVQKVKATIKDQSAAKDQSIPNKDLILESYSSSKFMFEDAIFAACQFTALKQGNPPLSKEEFAKSLEKMAEAGILIRIQQGEKIMWKRNE